MIATSVLERDLQLNANARPPMAVPMSVKIVRATETGFGSLLIHSP